MMLHAKYESSSSNSLGQEAKQTLERLNFETLKGINFLNFHCNCSLDPLFCFSSTLIRFELYLFFIT